MSKKLDTSWGNSAEWYDDLISGDDSFQTKVIMPNLLRLMKIERGDQLLDVGCGTGFFSREFAWAGAKVVGVDVGPELLKIAKQNSPMSEFILGSADKLDFIKSETVDKITFVLSLQNMPDVSAAIGEAARCLRRGGKMYLVLNHPAFRIPGSSSWGWDSQRQVEYRRLDSYLSEKKVKIDMHPGKQEQITTWSFHSPLQYYFKIFNKYGLLTERLEEWVSHRKVVAGPRKTAENRAKAEFPLFLALVLVRG